jgi:hypothetical protein
MKKFNSRKPKPAQLEVQWSEPESFALITQSAVDGDRVAKEAAQRAADQQTSDRLQAEFQPQPIQPIRHT